LARPGTGRRHVRCRSQGRCDREDQGQGNRRCDEASRLRRRRCLPWSAPQSPQARFDRRSRDTWSRVQGYAHGRPYGRCQAHHPEPHDPRRGQREQLPAHQGCRPRSQGWSRPRSLGREGGLNDMTDVKTVDVLDAAGAKAGSVDLPAEVFGVAANVPLIHQVVVAQLAAARQDTHKTKTRAEVRGGGRKPCRQKGTGNARQGSIRAPQYSGGGSVHGAVPRDYSQRTPKKMNAAALRGALSDRARLDQVFVVKNLVTGDAPSTKQAKAVLAGLSERKNTLVVLDRDDELNYLSVRNLPHVHVLTYDQLNTYDVLVADDIVFTEAALQSFLSGNRRSEDAS